jgi:hypothetical protein
VTALIVEAIQGCRDGCAVIAKGEVATQIPVRYNGICEIALAWLDPSLLQRFSGHLRASQGANRYPASLQVSEQVTTYEA